MGCTGSKRAQPVLLIPPIPATEPHPTETDPAKLVVDKSPGFDPTLVVQLEDVELSPTLPTASNLPQLPAPSDAAMLVLFAKIWTSEASIRESTEINWISKGLDGEDCRVIASLIGKGAMHQVTHLELRNNSIGDPGLRYLSEALANGGMTKLQWLDLSENFVGDLELFSVCYPPVGIMVYK